MKIILSGGTGYAGKLITDYFKKDEIYILTRSTEDKPSSDRIHYVEWDSKTVGDWKSVLEDSDVLINLAGKNINCRFTEENKKKILNSRIQSTETLGKAIEQCLNPPKMWLNASSVAVYEESYQTAKTEESPINGKDFLSIVSKKWENAFYKYGGGRTDKAVFRISLIMGENKGSAMNTLKKLVKFGGGGAAGTGNQMVSWIGEKDFVRGLEFIIQNQLTGAFNFCTPTALSNAELMKELRKKYNVPFGLPAPEFMIKIGAPIIGTSPELVLRSQNTYPKRLLEKGFEFEVTSIQDI